MATIDTVRLNALTIKYLLGTLTEEERRELDAILEKDPVHRQRFEQRVDKVWLKKRLEDYMGAQRRLAAPRRTASVRMLRRYLPYAAAVLLIAIGLVWWRSPRQHGPEAVIAMSYEIPAGGNRAKLTLSDGQVIDLDSAGNGVISKQGGANIIKTGSGAIEYRTSGAAGSTGGISMGASAYNVVSTPRGGTYQVALPDGSRAWLNAASTIRFPTAFGAGRREVAVSGEAYFDITPDAARPFYVSGGRAAVQVLGTEFDLQNYNDEPAIQVTLVNGSVRVQSRKEGQVLSAGQQEKVLTAGQQARLTADATISIVDQPDISQAIAWKTGFFKLKNADIRSIMREIERWYDVEVEYRITDYSMKYGGRISRGLPLSQLLRLLQENNIHHYKMEGHKLIVLP
jgi:ferric-dicitrate binding protein FerR (iron transport regulator)